MDSQAQTPHKISAWWDRFYAFSVLLIVCFVAAALYAYISDNFGLSNPSIDTSFPSLMMIGYFALGIIIVIDLILLFITLIKIWKLRRKNLNDVLLEKYLLVKRSATLLAFFAGLIVSGLLLMIAVLFGTQIRALIGPYPVGRGGGPYPAPCGSIPCAVPLKPVIYLYPTHPEKVSVTLTYAGTLTTLYPAFNHDSTWDVIAYPDGHLIDAGKEYSYLFWEGEDSHQYDMSTGFVVKGSDTAMFLQDQLATMGLTPKEYNEFIVYWLPKLQNNPYNLIHFAGSDYTDIAKLSITPTPDSMLRIFMVYKPLTEPISVAPQTFPTFTRKGFTVVEWGGTEY